MRHVKTTMPTIKRRGRQSGMRDVIVIPGCFCRRCGKQITAIGGTSEKELRSVAPDMCRDCVSLFLCKVAIVLQNARPDNPFSNQHPGHEDRLLKYQELAEKKQPLFS